MRLPNAAHAFHPWRIHEIAPDFELECEKGARPAFSSVYQTRDEWAAEVSNQTVHAVMHLGWVRDDSGSGYHAQIRPFRLAIVYPLMLRSIGQKWRGNERF